MRTWLPIGAMVLAVLVWFVVLAAPAVTPGQVRGPIPDSRDYAYGAEALLHGRYVVSWDNAPHIPRYTPGFAMLLMPAVALGGVAASVWVPFGSALVLAVLAALLARRLGPPIAAPLAAGAVLCAVGPVVLSRMVMSDLPAATLAVGELALITLVPGVGSTIAAGVLAAVLVWVRPTNVILLLAGIAGLSVRPDRKKQVAVYLLAAAPLLILLGSWQWAIYGSPLTTGYQAAGYGPGGDGTVSSLFSIPYIWKSPQWLVDMDAHPFRWQLPNIALYPLALLGADAFLTLPFVGALGLVTLVRWLRGTDAKAVVGRFGLAVLLLVLGVHLVYWYQAERFLLLPSSLLNIAGAVALASGLEAVRRRITLSDHWKRAPIALQPAHFQRLGVVVPVAITLVGLGLLFHSVAEKVTETEDGSAFTHGVSELHEELDRYGIQ